MTDWYLLRKFRDDRSEAAFAQLVARYLKLVYSVCYAELQNAQAAEDAAQAVFLILARKPQFSRGATLAGWLFRTATYVAKHTRRAEARRARMQGDLQILHRDEDASGTASAEDRLLLTEALGVLREADREALLLRYYQDFTLAEVGEALGVSEEAARKRVTRGLEKLRAYLQRQEPATAALALLAAGAVASVPAEARQTALMHAISQSLVSSAGHAASVTTAHQITMEVFRKMLVTKIQWATACAIVVVGVGSGATYVMGQGTDGAVHKAYSRPAAPPIPPTPDQEREAALQRESYRRMREVEDAFVTYIKDYNYTMPSMTSGDHVRKVLWPYVKHPQVDYLQPGVNKPYQFNASLSFRSLATIKHPEAVIFFVEPQPYQNGWRYIAYLDGHVKLQSQGMYAQQLADQDKANPLSDQRKAEIKFLTAQRKGYVNQLRGMTAQRDVERQHHASALLIDKSSREIAIVNGGINSLTSRLNKLAKDQEADASSQRMP